MRAVPDNMAGQLGSVPYPYFMVWGLTKKWDFVGAPNSTYAAHGPDV
jgi:hypothetical protein